MLLHEAIEKVLIQKGRPMSTGEIADELNKNLWYQKKDGSKIKAYQIHGRTKNYDHLFDRDGSIVFLIGQRATISVSDNNKEKKPKIEPSPFSSENLLPLESNLMNEENYKSASLIDKIIPNDPGLYCLRINDVDNLPDPFNKILAKRQHNIIYMGIATKSLQRRFLNQELRAKGHGTFFRSIGAVLGYLPPKGSLLEMKNKRNYKFSEVDERKIIEWINNNLKVNWVNVNGDFENLETQLINKYRPLINLAKNPSALTLLSDLRKECARVANS